MRTATAIDRLLRQWATHAVLPLWQHRRALDDSSFLRMPDYVLHDHALPEDVRAIYDQSATDGGLTGYWTRSGGQIWMVTAGHFCGWALDRSSPATAFAILLYGNDGRLKRASIWRRDTAAG